VLKRFPLSYRVGLLAVVPGGMRSQFAMEYPKPYGSLTTLIPGWERYSSSNGPPNPEHRGSADSTVYVYNRYGE